MDNTPHVPKLMSRPEIERGKLGMWITLNPEQRMSYALNLVKQHSEETKQLLDIVKQLVPEYLEWKKGNKNGKS